jgi:phenylacetate-coenzyme A ligase PaaK-like adenylate-forming protein
MRKEIEKNGGYRDRYLRAVRDNRGRSGVECQLKTASPAVRCVYPEVIDPGTTRPVPPGTPGELVLSPITK